MSWKKRLRQELGDIMVEVKAELGTGRITGHHLVSLKVGDVIQLRQDVNDFLVAKIEGVPKLKGRAGTIKGNKAIKIEKRI
jgi:flagellar motor switch protein FliM